MPLIPILMPQLGESIAEATVKHIAVAVGDQVTADQEIIEVETQKATMGVTIPCSGRVSEIRASVEISYPVGATLGLLEVTAEEARRAGIEPLGPPPSAGGSAEAAAAPPADNVHFRFEATESFAAGDTLQVEPLVKGLPVPANATGATYISPRMRARMSELGLHAADLAAVAGSGAGGRVTVEDLEKFLTALEDHQTSQASPMRVAVADAMRRSCTRPLATVGIALGLDPMLAHRRASAPPRPGPALYAIRALALALAERPESAGRLVGNRIVHPKAIDIGFAVEVEDGVLVPVLRGVDRRPLSELIHAYNELVDLGREKRLPLEAVGGGIATVTNFGTFGIAWATPIPLPEQNLVLGLGAGSKVPQWSDSEQKFLPATQAHLTLSFDHRILDGGGAGRLLHRVAELMQRPEAL